MTNEPIKAPDVDVDVLPPTKKEPASWEGRRAYRMRPASREIKLLRPSCKICADAVGGKKYLPSNWQDSCPHDPYVTLTEKHTVVPIYEDIVTAGKKTGSKRVTGTETIVEYVPVPNWTSATHAGGVNKGRGVDKALRRGYIYPQMLRSPVWPNGIKPRCQFRECYAEDRHRFANGWFCRQEEAGLVRISDNSESYQVDFDERSRQFQQDQLDAAMAKVAAR